MTTIYKVVRGGKRKRAHIEASDEEYGLLCHTSLDYYEVESEALLRESYILATVKKLCGNCARALEGRRLKGDHEHHWPAVLHYDEGIVHVSVCAEAQLEAEEVVARSNVLRPTGTKRPWRLHDGPFKSGEENPCPCNLLPEKRRHWLLVC